MKIATHHEIENKFPRILERISSGEQICTWSVQNDDYDDDIYNGTRAQCAAYAKRTAREELREDGCTRIVGIALIELDSEGSSVYTHDFIALADL